MINIKKFLLKKNYYRKNLLEKYREKYFVLEFKKVYNQSVLDYVVTQKYYKDDWH